MSEWIQALKVALINEDDERLVALYEKMPDRFESLTQAQEAAALMGQVVLLLKRKRSQVEAELAKTKAAISYQKQQAFASAQHLDLKE